MLTLHCPHCHLTVDETECVQTGEAHPRRPGPGASDAAFQAYLFEKENPKGVHFEYWRHAFGCGKWFIAARCTVTLEVFGTYPAQRADPPEALLATIRDRRPGWRWREFS